MRPRTFEELNNPERLRALQTSLSPYHTPKVIRNYIRNHYAVDLIDWMYDVAKGEITFETGALDKEGKPVMAPAPIATRAFLAKTVVEFATIGASVHHLGDDNESVQGAIALPELELQNAQRRVHGSNTAYPGAAMKALSGETFKKPPTFGGGNEIVVDEYTMPVKKPTNGSNGHTNGQP